MIEYVHSDTWSDGTPFKPLRDIAVETPPRRATVAAYIRDYCIAATDNIEAPPVNGPVLPTRDESLVTWRANVMNRLPPPTELHGRGRPKGSCNKVKKVRLPKEITSRPKRNSVPGGNRVQRLDTGEIYANTVLAAASVGRADGAGIRRSANNRGNTLAYGIRWLYVGDTLDESPRRKHAGGSRPRYKFTNLDTGEVYVSLNKLALALSMNVSVLSVMFSKSPISMIGSHRWQRESMGQEEQATTPDEQQSQISSPESAG